MKIKLEIEIDLPATDYDPFVSENGKCDEELKYELWKWFIQGPEVHALKCSLDTNHAGNYYKMWANTIKKAKWSAIALDKPEISVTVTSS